MSLFWLLRRLAGLVLALAAASAVIFILMDLLPGDPAEIMLGTNARPDTLAALRAEMGLDRPALIRYGDWAIGLLQGDFGRSLTYSVPVAELLRERLAVTLPLAVMAIALTLLIALPLGAMAAARRNSLTDSAIVAITQLGVAIPNFWFAMMLVLVFAISWRWLPSGGFPGWSVGPSAFLALILPSIALALPQAAILTRVMRASLLETLGEDYVRTARAKGLTRSEALRRHAFRNALIPVLTILGLQFSFLIAGTVVIENVFSLPGLGRLVFQAINQRDLVVVRSVVMVLIGSIIIVNFCVDLAYALVDPRLRGRA
jgi:peptide/nickel transport system permease protein